MTFGWQGFTLEHPDDWAPVALNGSRDEGYVRIASSGRVACQIRWKTGDASGLTDRLRAYLGKLEKDAKKAKNDFDADIEDDDGTLAYRYRGAFHGSGALFHSDACGRVFFLEVVSSRNDGLRSQLRPVVKSFAPPPAGKDRWALLGLDLMLPYGLKVERTVLEAGHTRLDLVAKGVRVTGERWGFAEQLLAKHGIEPWALAVLKLGKASAETDACGLIIKKRGLVPTRALVCHQPDRNQLVTLAVRSRKTEWRPTWDWIG